MSKGHSPSIDEPDIAYGFKMHNRTEKFTVSLEDINAHTFRIMEIIEQEKTQIKEKKRKRMMKNGRSRT